MILSCTANPTDAPIVRGIGYLILGSFLTLTSLLIIMPKLEVFRLQTKTRAMVFLGFVAGSVLFPCIVFYMDSKYQYAMLGVIFGFGTDWISTVNKSQGPQDAISRASRIIGGTVKQLSDVADSAEIEKFDSPAFTAMIWSALLTILFMMVLGLALAPFFQPVQQ
jgi:hypothetical protein